MRKYKKTFLTQVQIGSEVLVQLTLIDSHFKTACVNTCDDILSITVVSSDDAGIYILAPSSISEKSIKFSTKAPLGCIESIFVNTQEKSIEIEF